MRPPIEPPLGDVDLFQKLKGTSDTDITAKTRAAHPFSTEDDENHQRFSKSAERETLRKIRHQTYWVFFGLGCFIAAALVLMAVVACGYYLSNILIGTEIADKKGLGDIIANAVGGVLVALATLYLEKIIKSRND